MATLQNIIKELVDVEAEQQRLLNTEYDPTSPMYYGKRDAVAKLQETKQALMTQKRRLEAARRAGQRV